MNRPLNGRGRGRGRGGRGASQGGAQGNCNPRLPALHLETKNPQSVNRGRWFYKCQNGKPHEGGCGFWLWDDETKASEEAAVLSNPRSEPRPAASTPGRDDSSRPQSLYRMASPPSSPFSSPRTLNHDTFEDAVASPSRRRLPWKADSSRESDGEQADFRPAAGEEVEEALKAAEAMMPPPITPRKAPAPDMFLTPSKRKFSHMDRDQNDDLPTPDTGRKSREISRTPAHDVNRTTSLSSQHPNDNTFGGSSQPFVSQTPPATPTPSRPKDAGAEGSDTLIQEVFDLLQEHAVALPTPTKDSLTRILRKHVLRTQGILKGRESGRAALAEKEKQAAELQSRVGVLEAELEAAKAVAQHIREMARRVDRMAAVM